MARFFAGPLASALAGAQRRGAEGEREQYERQRSEQQYQDSMLMRELAMRNQEQQTQALSQWREQQVAASQAEAARRQKEQEAAAQDEQATVDALTAQGIEPARARAIVKQGVAGQYLAPPKPTEQKAPVPGTPEWEKWYRTKAAIDAANRPPKDDGPPAPPRITAAERQNSALYEFAEPSAERALKRYGEGKAPSFMDRVGEGLKGHWYTPDWLGNTVQSDEGQQMYDDLTQVVMATQYALSGKAVTENEARRLARGLLPQIGDKPGRAAQKIQEINNRMRVLRKAAGRGVDPNAPELEPTTVDELNDAAPPPPRKPAGRPSDYLNRQP